MTLRTIGKDVNSVEHPADQSPPRPEKANGKSRGGAVSPPQPSFRLSSDDDRSIYSAENEHDGQRGRLLAPSALRYKSVSPTTAPSGSWRAKGNALWTASKGLVLVLVAQLYAPGAATPNPQGRA
ncbi:MAG: hypothetical protein Q9184_008047 [Pyrenodesmia sp. 2 TL-2023]